MKRLFFICFTIFLPSIVISSLSLASNNMTITGRFYAQEPENSGNYIEKIKWNITSQNTWITLLDDIKKSTPITNNIPALRSGEPDIVHISQLNSDNISGNEIFISEKGIHLFEYTTLDSYFLGTSVLKDHLQSELKTRATLESRINPPPLNSLGIVIQYNESNNLGVPTWVVTAKEAEEFKYLTSILMQLRNSPPSHVDTFNINIQFDELGSFTLRPNYPDSPFKYVTVAPNGNIRTTIIKKKYSFHPDARGYYFAFKRQAQDNIRAKNNELKNDKKDDFEKLRKQLPANQSSDF